MEEAAGIQSKINQIKQKALHLESQGFQLDLELQKDRFELSRLLAFELKQQQALKTTQETIAVIETKLKKVSSARLVNKNETNNAR